MFETLPRITRPDPLRGVVLPITDSLILTKNIINTRFK